MRPFTLFVHYRGHCFSYIYSYQSFCMKLCIIILTHILKISTRDRIFQRLEVWSEVDWLRVNIWWGKFSKHSCRVFFWIFESLPKIRWKMFVKIPKFQGIFAKISNKLPKVKKKFLKKQLCNPSYNALFRTHEMAYY